MKNLTNQASIERKNAERRSVRTPGLCLGILYLLVIAGLEPQEARAQLASNASSLRFTRGVFDTNSGYFASFQSAIIPVDFQKGIPLPATNSVSNLFTNNPWTNLFYHFDGQAFDWTIPFKSPIAAFGSRVGGSPLYVGESYRFGVYAGILDWDARISNYISMRIQVYYKTNLAYVGTVNL